MIEPISVSNKSNSSSCMKALIMVVYAIEKSKQTVNLMPIGLVGANPTTTTLSQYLTN
jgi:hypothetical protein